MKSFKKIIACTLALASIASLTACDESDTPASSTDGGLSPTIATTTAASTTTDPDENADTDREIKDINTDSYTPSGNAGTVKYLSFYDISTDQKGTEQCLIFTSELYGGSLEYISSPSGDAYYDKLGSLIAADDSPDIVTKDAMLYPGNVSKNLFEPLDDYIDIDSALWADMKDVIDSFEYKGKHYYFPHRITTSFALNYSKKTIEENNLPDPYELYKNGEWTWDAWRNMMIEFCNKSEDNIGFYATDTILTSLIATTGTTLIDTQPNGTIINNISDVNVTRAMSFYETLYRDGVMYAKQLGDWVPPQTFATNCDKLLFLGMEPEWTYTAATEQIQNPTGVDNDIFNTVSDFAFVPFPRDTEADAYYQAYDTYGFLIPKGAKNIQGAVDFINCFRVYDTDEEVQEQVKEDHINPTPIYYTTGKYEGSQKWQITWGETEYDMWREMCDPNVFTFVTEDAFGFNSDFWDQYAEVLTSVAFDGESWAQKSSEFSPIVEATVDEFRF
jgi:multiple sugar transport system substrate-binding protein